MRTNKKKTHHSYLDSFRGIFGTTVLVTKVFGTKVLGTALIGIFILLFLASPAVAQKKEKKKDLKSAPAAISDSDILEGEYYFIEGQRYFMVDDYEKALEYFLQAHEKNPRNGAINFKIAEIHVNDGAYTQALPYALSAIEDDPTNKYYYLTTANVYTSLSNFDQAAATFEKMLATVPGTEMHYFELAAIYMYQKELDKALATYDRAKEAFGPMEQITVQKQKIYLNQNKLEEAIREGDELIEAFPGLPDLLINQAEILISNNQDERAIGYLNKVMAEDPNNVQASIFLSEIYRKQGKVDLATELLQVAFGNPTLNFDAKIQMLAGYISQLPDVTLEPLIIKLTQILIDAHPDESNAYAIAGDLYYQLGKETEALEMYRKVLTLDKSNFGLWQNVLSIEMTNGNYDSVIVYSEQALEIFPNQSALYYYNGTAHLIKKNNQAAVDILEQGVKYVGNNKQLKSVFFGQMGDAYNALKDNQKSDEAYEKALEAKPDNDHVLNNYSYFLSLRKEQLQKAKQMSLMLVERFPENPTYLDTHGWVLYVMEDYQGAHKYLEKAAKSEDASGTILEHYGDVLYQLGKKEQALEQWEKAKELGEASDKLDKKIADRTIYE